MLFLLGKYLFLTTILKYLSVLSQQAPLAQPESPTASAGEDARTPPDSGESDKESVSSSSNGNGDSSATGSGGVKSGGGSSSSSSSSSNSSAGTTGTLGKEKKDKKEKDKDKDKKRADSVANKLGSFGKSLGSKLKKNVGGLMTGKNATGSGGKPSEGTEKKKGSLRGRKGSKDGSPSVQTGSEDSGKGSPSSGSERQNGNSSSSESDPYKYSSDVKVSLSILRAAMQGERRYIFAGLLTTSNRQPYQEEMIQRYLADAEERFRAEQEQRREAERKPGVANGVQLKKEPSDLGYRSFESKEDATDGAPPTFKSPSFSPSVYSGVVPIPRPTFIDQSPAPLTRHLHMHGYIDARRQLAGGSPSTYPGLPSYATLPRHCPMAQGPPHPQYHPPAPSATVVSPSRITPCFTTYGQEQEPPDFLSDSQVGGYTNGPRDPRSVLDSRNGPPPVRHYSLGSAGGLANLQSSRCRTPSCNYYGHPETCNYCSYCYREELKKRETEPAIRRF